MGALSAQAGDLEASLIHRISLGYQAGFNVKTDFRNLGEGSASAPGDALPATPHTYDNGYVLVDRSGNAGGLTWNWGYQSDNQVVGDQLLFSASEPGLLAGDVQETPAHGLELAYALELRRFGHFRLGLVAAFGLGNVDVQSSGAASPEVLTAEAFELGGIVPPQAPYAGSYDGPSALIGDTPSRMTVAVDARLEALLYGFRLGPYVEIPITPRGSLSFSGGLLLVIADGEFAYEQAVSGPLAEKLYASGVTSESDVLPGGYLAVEVSGRLTHDTEAFLGVHYRTASRFDLIAGDKQAILDLRDTVFLTAGFRFWF